eukprot:2586937-Pyramimonas_sp.AAC.1
MHDPQSGTQSLTRRHTSLVLRFAHDHSDVAGVALGCPKAEPPGDVVCLIARGQIVGRPLTRCSVALSAPLHRVP